MSKEDLECPYCGCVMDVSCYEIDRLSECDLNEKVCEECGKSFVFTTSVSFSYHGHRADCLNGAAHKYESTRSYPVRYTRMRCVDCGDERDCTPEEMNEVISGRDK